MTYTVKEIFYTLQGEGAQTGRPAVFCRFAGCNLWSGRESHRAKAVCRFCDTDFVGTNGEGGGKFRSSKELADAVAENWPVEDRLGKRFVVCTGGEPLLQLDETLVEAFHSEGFTVAIETNGTQSPPRGLDWICVSPKANTDVVLRAGNELKLVFPQEGIDPREFVSWHFDHFFLSPMDCAERQHNTALAVEYCKKNPKWRLSLQTHKYLGIP
jgi:7-carboxy-7-deazaguanine synthase (Cx14CxxC type)